MPHPLHRQLAPTPESATGNDRSAFDSFILKTALRKALKPAAPTRRFLCRFLDAGRFNAVSLVIPASNNLHTGGISSPMLQHNGRVMTLWSPACTIRRMLDNPLREWQERYSRSGTRVGFKPEADAPFCSSIEPICNSPRIVRTTLSPGLLFRDRKMVRDGDDNVSLVVSLGRALTISHRNREACLARNEAILFQADAPGSAGTRQRFAVLEVSTARREWDSRNARPGDVLTNVINRNSQTLTLLLGYIRALAKSGLPSAARAQQLVPRHLIDLVVLAATEPSLGESRIDCVVAARRAAVLDYITSHFCDQNLSGSSLAKKLGISQRYLQRLLEPTGKTFTEHINELRLDEAFSLLVTKGANKRVSDIAFDVGYSDLTNFYRHFRSRFGDTPKGVAGSAPSVERPGR